MLDVVIIIQLHKFQGTGFFYDNFIKKPIELIWSNDQTMTCAQQRRMRVCHISIACTFLRKSFIQLDDASNFQEGTDWSSRFQEGTAWSSRFQEGKKTCGK